MRVKRIATVLSVGLLVCSAVADTTGNAGPGARYATDAYPGFDHIEGVTKPEKKEPRWFSWINGPKMADAKSQFAWAQELEVGESWGRARRAYDALVRQWPTAPEAPKAQLRMAEILLEKELDYEDAFAEYRYLLDFYSLQCDYDAICGKMYQIAELMRQEGKTIVFFRFKNTTDVRRTYEALVLHSPGASFVPQAMLTIAQLREDSDELGEAVSVYENLRNRFPGTKESNEALRREAAARMEILRKHGYNRVRVMDTKSFVEQGLRSELSDEALVQLREWLAEIILLEEGEAYRAAKFYDSPTRTRHSAIDAYEDFLRLYPTSERADTVRERIAVLKEKDRADAERAAAKKAEAEAEKDAEAVAKAEEEKK